jgi:hypothetical protein
MAVDDGKKDGRGADGSEDFGPCGVRKCIFISKEAAEAALDIASENERLNAAGPRNFSKVVDVAIREYAANRRSKTEASQGCPLFKPGKGKYVHPGY